VKRPIVDAWAAGEKRLFEVTTRLGRKIRCTGGHRFLTIAGWAKLEELQIGDQIAVPRVYGAPQWKGATSSMNARKGLLLGWLLGDGHLGGSATLTVATRPEAELAALLGREEFGLAPVVKPERKGTDALRVIMTTGRLCGAGKNPLTTWLRELGAWKKSGAHKSVPGEVFSQNDEIIAAFLRGLFHADGSLSRKQSSSSVVVRLSTISAELARDVQHLLLRLGINAGISGDTRNIGGFRSKTTCIWTVRITDRHAVNVFFSKIGFLSDKHEVAVAKVNSNKQNDAGHIDRLPLMVNELVTELRRGYALTHLQLGWRDQGKAMSRSTCAALAERLDDEELAVLAHSDVLWDTITHITPLSVEMTYDLTVGELHNFCVDDFITHNSGALEQEADMVAFLFREGYYNAEAADPELTEFIISKHRNGPTGVAKLRFVREFTLFQRYGDASHYPSP
jgi:replicative DNA helicase